MKSKKCTLSIICAVFLVVILIANSANAISFGCGPSQLQFDNMLTGYWYGQKTIVPGTGGEDNLVCDVNTEGDVADWISIEPFTDFNLPGRASIALEVVVKVPPGVPVGTYYGKVRPKACPEYCPPGGICFCVAINVQVIVDVVGEATTNSPPSTESAHIVPDPAYTNSNLTCHDVNTTDHDGQPVRFYYKWYKNGELIASYPFPIRNGDDGHSPGRSCLILLTLQIFQYSLMIGN